MCAECGKGTVARPSRCPTLHWHLHMITATLTLTVDVCMCPGLRGYKPHYSDMVQLASPYNLIILHLQIWTLIALLSYNERKVHMRVCVCVPIII